MRYTLVLLNEDTVDLVLEGLDKLADAYADDDAPGGRMDQAHDVFMYVCDRCDRSRIDYRIGARAWRNTNHRQLEEST